MKISFCQRSLRIFADNCDLMPARVRQLSVSPALVPASPLIGPNTILWNPPVSEISPGAVMREEM